MTRRQKRNKLYLLQFAMDTNHKGFDGLVMIQLKWPSIQIDQKPWQKWMKRRIQINYTTTHFLNRSFSHWTSPEAHFLSPAPRRFRFYLLLFFFSHISKWFWVFKSKIIRIRVRLNVVRNAMVPYDWHETKSRWMHNKWATHFTGFMCKKN